jgi:hypothetical protein
MEEVSMAGGTIQPDYLEFLEWCRGRADVLSRKAVLIAENVDRTNRTGHLYRGYLAAVHFLRENPDVQAYLRSLALSERQPFNHRSPQFAPAWSGFMAKHGAKHLILRHILPERYGGLTKTGGGGAYPFQVALRLAAEFLAQTAPKVSEKSAVKIPAKYRMVRRKDFDRDYPALDELKALYEHRCQVCQRRLELGREKYYCEAHHLRPLGREHRGPADMSNVVILCPNHHAEFDFFLFAILDYQGMSRKLEHMMRELAAGERELLVRHTIAPEHIDYVTEQFLTRLDLQKES